MKQSISAHDIRRIAVASYSDPRSVHRYFTGRARSTTTARIEIALAELGLSHLIRTTAGGTA